MNLKALIFDVDGTLAETETLHLKAFNATFAEAGLDWYWDQALYRKLLAVAGGKERIHHFIIEYSPTLPECEDIDTWVADLQRKKTALYGQMLAAGEIELRPGVERLIREAHERGLRLAIATTTSMVNLTSLFSATLGHECLDWFEVIGASEQATEKKPNPSVYLWVLQQLNLNVQECLAIEDTCNGVQAASNAGIPVLVTQSDYSEGEDFSGAVAVLNNLGEPELPCHSIFGSNTPYHYVNVDLLQHWRTNFQ